MKHFTILAAVATLLASPVLAAKAENTLVIDVAGAHSGTIEIELFPDVAPNHVARIKKLARDGQYNNIAFHRVIPGFMAQTGDVQHGNRNRYNLRYAGTGGSSYRDLEAEFSDIPYETGVVGMARSSDVDSANSQFFIMLAAKPHLNGLYTVVGKVIAGQDVVDAIKTGDRNLNGAVATPDYMERVRIKSDPAE